MAFGKLLSPFQMFGKLRVAAQTAVPVVIMSKKLATYLLLLLLLLNALTACGPDEGEPTLPLEPCQLEGGVAAQCGTLAVPENRELDDTRMIDLNIAVIPANDNNPQPDPLFMLAGGPGQAAVDTYPLVISALEDLNEERAIVLVDQRGTGASGALSCENLQDEALPPDLTDEEVTELLQACATTLAETVDLTQYTTEIAMTDLDEVRQALGFEQINLYGASYGTRAALTYARLFPERVRTMVLDAVVGPDLTLFLQMPRDGERALELLFERCATDPICNDTFPDLEAEYDALLARLDEPRMLTVTDPVSGEALEITLTRDRFTRFIFNTLYSTDLVALLPLLIHQAHETGDYGPLVAQAFAVGAVSGLEPGLLYAVTCTEDAPFIDVSDVERLQESTRFAAQSALFLEICEAFPSGEVSPALREPLESDIPTLLLSGEADPVTPPAYAAGVAEFLPNSRHVIAPYFGHGLLTRGCVPRLMTSFIAGGSIEDLDVSCAEELRPPPFFVNFAGPPP